MSALKCRIWALIPKAVRFCDEHSTRTWTSGRASHFYLAWVSGSFRLFIGVGNRVFTGNQGVDVWCIRITRRPGENRTWPGSESQDVGRPRPVHSWNAQMMPGWFCVTSDGSEVRCLLQYYVVTLFLSCPANMPVMARSSYHWIWKCLGSWKYMGRACVQVRVRACVHMCLFSEAHSRWLALWHVIRVMWTC